MSTVYTGIDFHKRTSTICFLDKNGKKEIKTILSDNLVSELVNRKNLLIGIEASCGVNHVVDELKKVNLDVKIINPNKFRGVGIGGKKTDKKDAVALAECLKVGFIPTVYHKSIASRRIKSLLRIREQFVQSRVSLTNHTRGILREYGLKMPAGTESFWEEVQEKINLIDFDPIKNHLTDLVFEARKLKTK
jgi:transposase